MLLPRIVKIGWYLTELSQIWKGWRFFWDTECLMSIWASILPTLHCSQRLLCHSNDETFSKFHARISDLHARPFLWSRNISPLHLMLCICIQQTMRARFSEFEGNSLCRHILQRDFAWFLVLFIQKPLSENSVMPLWTSICIKISSAIARFSLRYSTAFLLFFLSVYAHIFLYYLSLCQLTY